MFFFSSYLFLVTPRVFSLRDLSSSFSFSSLSEIKRGKRLARLLTLTLFSSVSGITSTVDDNAEGEQKEIKGEEEEDNISPSSTF